MSVDYGGEVHYWLILGTSRADKRRVKVATRRILTTFSTTLVVVVLAAAWAIASPLQVSCAVAAPLEQIQQAPSESAGFVAAINQLRAGLGLNPLEVDAELSNVANGWAVQMAQNDGISHRLDLRAGISALWRTLGENVGFGPTVSQLMDAFIGSAGHYKNLVDPKFTRIGVGTVRVGDMLYTAHEFMGLQADTTPVIASPPPTTPATTPKVTTPRVTAPPVTEAPTTVAPTPTTMPTVETTVALQADHELQDSSGDDHQQQQSKRDSRCRSHSKNLDSLVL